MCLEMQEFAANLIAHFGPGKMVMNRGDSTVGFWWFVVSEINHSSHQILSEILWFASSKILLLLGEETFGIQQATLYIPVYIYIY